MTKAHALAPEELGPVSPASLDRAEKAQAADIAGNGGGNLLRHIEHAAPAELKALVAERDLLVAKVLDLNTRIAKVQTHALVSPRDA